MVGRLYHAMLAHAGDAPGCSARKGSTGACDQAGEGIGGRAQAKAMAGQGEIQQPIRTVRVELEAAPGRGRAAGRSAVALQGGAEVRMRLGIVGLELHGAAKTEPWPGQGRCATGTSPRGRCSRLGFAGMPGWRFAAGPHPARNRPPQTRSAPERAAAPDRPGRAAAGPGSAPGPVPGALHGSRSGSRPGAFPRRRARRGRQRFRAQEEYGCLRLFSRHVSFGAHLRTPKQKLYLTGRESAVECSGAAIIGRPGSSWWPGGRGKRQHIDLASDSFPAPSEN